MTGVAKVHCLESVLDFSAEMTKILRSLGYRVTYKQVYGRLYKLGLITELGRPTKKAYRENLIVNV